MSEIDERDLALRCAKGDSEAQRELYRRYATRLNTLCSRYSRGSEEGMDLMHDTMIKALRGIGRYRYSGEGSLYAWLARMAINLSIDRFRKEGRFEITDLREDIPEENPPDTDAIRSVPLSVLQKMISGLPDTKRLVFNMFCIDGFSHKEIAERLGITEKSSSSTLAKAKKILMTKINEYGRLDTDIK